MPSTNVIFSHSGVATSKPTSGSKEQLQMQEQFSDFVVKIYNVRDVEQQIQLGSNENVI